MSRRSDDTHLSPREREVYYLIVREGMGEKEIAAALGISGETVKVHARNIIRIKGVKSRLELAVKYYQQEIPRMLAKILIPALILACVCRSSSAQVAMAPNMVVVCPEGCTLTAAPAATVFQFGVPSPDRFGPAFTLSSPSLLPLLIDYGTVANPLLAPSDPAPGVLKSLYAQETSTAYTVSWTDDTGAAQTTTVPALAVTPPVFIPNSGLTVSLGNFLATFQVMLNGSLWNCAIQNGAAPPAPPKYQLACSKAASQ